MLIFKEKKRVKSRTVLIETMLTGESLYNANQLLLNGINVATGKIGKKNKPSPIYTLYY